MRNADSHPSHDRGSCKEENPGYNADASYSGGCARCTALVMDQRDDLLAMMKRLINDRHAAKEAAVLVRKCDPSWDGR